MILLDTHALVWWRAGGDRLSPLAARRIARADAVLVSPISCWEVATLMSKGRLTLDRDVYVWIQDLYAEEQVDLAHLTPQTAVTAGLMDREGFPGDPADRLLYATAKELDVPLLTKDERVAEYARSARDVQTIW